MLSTWHLLISAYIGYLAAIGQPATTRDLRGWQLRHFAARMNKPVSRVTDTDVVEFFADHDWKPETRRSFRSAVRGFLEWAQRSGHILTNPAAGLPQIRVPKAAPRPASDNCYRDALVGADDRTRLMLRLARDAGLRRAEISRVHSRDVRSTPSGWELHVHGKGAHQRVVPIPDGLATALLAGGDGGYVFPSQRGGHLTPRTVGKMTSEALGSGVTCHMLRHAYATSVYRGSRNLLAVQKLLGHSNLAITERYLHIDSDELRSAMLTGQAA